MNLILDYKWLLLSQMNKHPSRKWAYLQRVHGGGGGERGRSHRERDGPAGRLDEAHRLVVGQLQGAAAVHGQDAVPDVQAAAPVGRAALDDAACKRTTCR